MGKNKKKEAEEEETWKDRDEGKKKKKTKNKNEGYYKRSNAFGNVSNMFTPSTDHINSTFNLSET